MIWIVFIVLVVVAADTIWARARIRLRERAAHAARPQSRGPEGWRSLQDADARDEPQQIAASFDRIDSILGGNARRGPR
jgi:hypothetical protein